MVAVKQEALPQPEYRHISQSHSSLEKHLSQDIASIWSGLQAP